MRYLIDTNIFIYLSTDREKLSLDVVELLNEPDTLAYMSAESVRELVIAYNNKGWGNKKWKSAEDLVNSIEETFFIEILPIAKDVMQTYSRLSVNKTMNHKDPSDHVIISHAMTLGIPLISSDTRFPYYTRQGLKLIYNEK